MAYRGAIINRRGKGASHAEGVGGASCGRERGSYGEGNERRRDLNSSEEL